MQHIGSNNQANTDSFLGSLEFSEKEIDIVASRTKKQWQCKEWYVHKRGFITASKAKNVYTRQILLRGNLRLMSLFLLTH